MINFYLFKIYLFNQFYICAFEFFIDFIKFMCKIIIYHLNPDQIQIKIAFNSL